MNTYAAKNNKACRTLCHADKIKKSSALPLLLTVLFLISALAFPSTVRSSVTDALNLCALTLVPSLFPFMVLGEIFFALGGHRPLARLFGKPFKRLFGIQGGGAGAFLLGAVCGLPLGAKYAVILYKNSEISKEECELLMGISNNAGMGFAVMGIGYTMWGSTAFGWLLYICQIIGASAAGILLSQNLKTEEKMRCIAPVTVQSTKKSFGSVLSEAVSSSAVNMLKLCGFVVTFGAISAFIEQACNALALPRLFFVTLSSFTEISFAAAKAHQFFLTGSASALHGAKILTFFAVGFAGMSVHAQTSSFAYSEGISMKKYYLAKLLCGLICALTGAVVLHYFDF